MRTKLLHLMACIAVLMPINSMAQNDEASSFDYFGKMKTDHWTVNAQGFYSVGQVSDDYYVGGIICDCPEKYWGLSANVQRKFYPIRGKGFWIGPGAGIQFSRAREYEGTEYTKFYCEYGLEVNGLAGYTFANNKIGIDLFAGIVGRLGLYKVANKYWPGTGYARVGFSLMRGHISITGAYDLAFTKYRHCGEPAVKGAMSTITFGLGYSF